MQTEQPLPAVTDEELSQAVSPLIASITNPLCRSGAVGEAQFLYAGLHVEEWGIRPRTGEYWPARIVIAGRCAILETLVSRAADRPVIAVINVRLRQDDFGRWRADVPPDGLELRERETRGSTDVTRSPNNSSDRTIEAFDGRWESVSEATRMSYYFVGDGTLWFSNGGEWRRGSIRRAAGDSLIIDGLSCPCSVGVEQERFIAYERDSDEGVHFERRR